MCDDRLVSGISLNLTIEHWLGNVVALWRKLDVAIECFHISRSERITHLVTIKAVCTFKGIRETNTAADA